MTAFPVAARHRVALCAGLSALSLAAPAFAQHDHDMSGMDHGDMPMPAAEPPAAHAAMDHAAMPMTGALGPYSMTREASGTSWQPDASAHGGVHGMAGGWTTMGHLTLDAVYSDQGGPRGDEKAFVAGMAMAAARRPLGSATLNLRAMLSPDPLMGRSGYPLLLASGETADGATALVDRQHPHDLFMELSASLSTRVGPKGSAFVYVGYPGEPAFGPPAFMHRPAATASPEAPISHHWLDSTHITFGVLTAGYVQGDWKAEVSRFTGREPDQERYGFDAPDLDSTAVRLSWNPTPNWALQASWADQVSPEQLHPEDDQTKWSLSALYGAGPFDATLAWGRRTATHGPDLDAWLGEASYQLAPRWTLFGRAERVETDELAGDHGDVHTVGKVSLGAAYDRKLAGPVSLGIGALYAKTFVSDALEPAYGGDPAGSMVFVRLKVG